LNEIGDDRKQFWDDLPELENQSPYFRGKRQIRFPANKRIVDGGQYSRGERGIVV
jgi:hypothetical protein